MDIHTDEPAGAGIGDNSEKFPEEAPAKTLKELLEPEHLLATFTVDFAAELKRTADLQASFERFLAKVDTVDEATGKAPGITSDEQQTLGVTFATQLKKHAKALEDLHKVEKKPYLEAGRTVDAFFKARSDKLIANAKVVEARLSVYATAKVMKERQEREEAARKAQEEADAAAAAAERTGNAEVFDTAIQAQEQADKAIKQAAAPTTSIGRVRSDYGGVGVTQDVYSFEITDLSLIPREYFDLNESRIKQAINRKTADRVTQIPGVKITHSVGVSAR